MSSSNTTMKNGRVRKCLPNNISPLHYDIFLNHKDDHFNGIVIIKISVKQETNIIRLNSKGLEIIRCEVDGTECSFSEEECEEFEINAVKKILDTSLLRIEFKGLISNNMKGFYVSRYSVNGHDKKLYSTKFEPTHARMLIPCFDQPDMKATFKLKLETDNVDVISNTDGKIQLLENGRKITSFEQTPKMSTYLLAFVIGELEYLEKEIPGIVIRTYTIKGEKGKGRYALDVAAQCLDFFQKHFSFPYPLKKLDLVGIPEFASGAMENWGLITFRETTLLYDPHNSNIHQKKRIAEVVCHEIAHQWFGNLVTMKWWDELWLNEGFATYAASLAMENIPIVNWDVWTDFIAIETERGLEEDALNSSHPIKVEVMDPNDIGQIFDGISYSKSASLIRMIENFIGREKFRSGLSRYINEFQYSNATTADLWEMLSDEKHDVANIMNCWVNRKGFPLVRVDEMNGQVVLTQEKFKPKLPDESAKDKSDDDLWMIPMTIISGKTKTKILMKQKTEKIHINGNFKVNHDGAAFIRVLYNSSKYILGNDFDVRDRLTFVNDIISLTLSSYIPIKIFLNMLNYFVYERNYEILKAPTQLSPYPPPPPQKEHQTQFALLSNRPFHI
ncbi:putative M1 family aminopeptidase 2 [Dictyocoela roeselum]|nr:putative M1 family aminopeptidase 2 [Dictyocoela roeselum]